MTMKSDLGCSAPFDDLAASYDEEFTESPLGSVLRAAVWRRLAPHLRPGARALDLGCGSGADAMWLAAAGMEVVAVDVSPAMAELARRRSRREGLEVRVVLGDMRTLNAMKECAGPFDLVLSNFGPLNCVGELAPVFGQLRSRLRRGGTMVAVIMGRIVPWEMIRMLLSRRPVAAWRRLRRGGVNWRGMSIRYYSPRSVRRAARLAGLRVTRMAGLGALLPVTEAGGWIARHRRLLAILDRCERKVETIPPVPWLADHLLVELQPQSDTSRLPSVADDLEPRSKDTAHAKQGVDRSGSTRRRSVCMIRQPPNPVYPVGRVCEIQDT